MAAYSNHSVNGARGFAASGTQLNGADQITLTSYIWEYLGNQMPSDIYGGSSPTCSDGIKNGDETGVDCGGSCSACSAVSMPIGAGTMAIGAGSMPISVQ